MRHLFRRKPTPAAEFDPLWSEFDATEPDLWRTRSLSHAREETLERLRTLSPERVPTSRILADHLALVGVA